MTVKLSPQQPTTDSELSFSFFVKGADGKPSRVGLARVLDISETGLCMEISPLDSDLFMEPFVGLPELNREIELQIFCRSHPSNVFVEGSVRWFKQKKEVAHSVDTAEALDICAGVVFAVDDPAKRRELGEMLGRMDNSTVSCAECGAPVSADGRFCYDCGIRLINKHEVLRSAIYDILAAPEEIDGGRER